MPLRRVPPIMTRGRTVPGGNRIAAAFVGKILVARGTAPFVAAAIGVDFEGLKKIARDRPPDIRVVISPARYTAERDGDDRVFGTAGEVAAAIESTSRDVCMASVRGNRCRGWKITRVAVPNEALPRRRIEQMRSELLIERSHGSRTGVS